MPRGFLVKRARGPGAYSYRRSSAEERSEEETDPLISTTGYTQFGSPDSGFSQSPVNLTFPSGGLLAVVGTTHSPMQVDNINNNNSSTIIHDVRPAVLPPSSTASEASSPRSASPSTPPYSSPVHFSGFDRLSVSSPPGPAASMSSPAGPASPASRKRASPDSIPETRVVKSPRKTKAMRRIQFDEDKTSPVSGTIIREPLPGEGSGEDGMRVVCGDIDSALNYVEVTPEARAELEKIDNKLGAYTCMLCKENYADAFHLAQHKCSRIVHVEYRCPECDKVFNCPANLASHRRWHKPRPAPGMQLGVPGRENQQPRTPSPPAEPGTLYDCDQCGKKFKRQSYLRKHMASHAAGVDDTKPFPCQFCGKVLRSEAARAKHVLQHAVGHAEGASCAVCGASFPNKAALERHERLHSAEVFTCKYCSANFYSSPGLTRHINKCHPSENRQVILLQMPVQRTC